MVTLSGFIVNLFPLFVMQALYGSSLAGHIDPWYPFLCAGCYTFYVIMDNSDGKQARITGASSPVGMLFDHFCDAICAVLNIYIVEKMLQVGESEMNMFWIGISTLPFYYVLVE